MSIHTYGDIDAIIRERTARLTQENDRLRDENARLRRLADSICHVVDVVEYRCMAVDGPVTPTLKEMTECELRDIWQAANRMRDDK